MTRPQPLPPDGAPRPNEDLPDPGPPTAPPAQRPDVTPGLPPAAPDGDLVTPGVAPGLGGVVPA
jgi:hypothetical protein